ncbi:Universal stress protein family [Indibacter alkaliphilus LW1]|uniref:Universal stress protein family n=1 Tax=Indibacter alkaliphilus (strain CCUG 57479 / KCTC 22604 / LW1) TaxID=1189612 RepID=S2D8S1_INDAL|nr:universal stress protein [Indibacter alkaliphilus]EOZ95592.1 Universal stress protein family [Indibacter alkaliphilus LW1]
MKTILVPYDFSKEAEYAFKFAQELAKNTTKKLKLFHVIELPGPQSFSSMGEAGAFNNDAQQIFMVELVEKRKKQMADLNAKFKDSPFTFESKIVFGNPFAGISKEIADADADLVVMGSKGSSGLEEVLIGSNTEKVVRNATCPVITVKNEIHPKDIKKVVFASDFDSVPDKVVDKLKKASIVIDAELHLVKINTPSMFENTRTSKQKIKDFVDKHGLKVASMDVYNSSSEEEGIIEYADDINADMIAMATHGRTGFLHLLSGSIAEDVVNAAKRPVWTMKSK